MRMGIGITMGLIFGISLWLMTDNLIFLAIGIGLGIAIGTAYNKEAQN